jgi:type III secretion protein S
MAPHGIAELVQQAAMIALLLSLPAALTAAVVGLFLGIAQAVTSIQDQSLAQSVKIVAVLLVVFLSAGWASGKMMELGREAFRNFPLMVK